MRNSKSILSALIMVALTTQGVAFAQQGGRNASSTAQPMQLTETESNSISYMREEEKMARDLYIAFDQKWGNMTPVFGNITQAEQRHMNSVKWLLDTYRLPDSAMQALGQFTDQHIQTLYNELVARGNSSILEAFKVGALVEEVDIDDLQKGLEQSSNTNVRAVYANLVQASENHLRAFTRQLIAQEGQYQAQVLPQATVDGILGESQGRGRGHGNGNGWRGGR